MPHKPGDPESEPESPGGHAADRLREFMGKRFPGSPPLPTETEPDATTPTAERDADQTGERDAADPASPPNPKQ